jgi:hypothetical protein
VVTVITLTWVVVIGGTMTLVAAGCELEIFSVEQNGLLVGTISIETDVSVSSSTETDVTSSTETDVTTSTEIEVSVNYKCQLFNFKFQLSNKP